MFFEVVFFLCFFFSSGVDFGGTTHTHTQRAKTTKPQSRNRRNALKTHRQDTDTTPQDDSSPSGSRLKVLSFDAVILQSLSSLGCTCVNGRLLSDDFARAALHAKSHFIQRGPSGRNTENLGEVGRQKVETSQRNEEIGWKRTQHAKKKEEEEEAGQFAPRDKLLEDGWSVKVKHTPAGFQRLRDGVFMANVREAKMLMAENALQRVFCSVSDQSQ